MDLVIVESPTKARTLSRFLGKDFKVASSKGHIRDLPKSELGVDISHDFAPNYVTIKGKGSVIRELKKAQRDAETLWLACDLDREGEAIAWHLAQILGFSEDEILAPSRKFRRVVFHEITKEAMEDAFSEPRGINLDLVSAQKARRVLDRLVGYKLSPLLWEKVRAGLSAGRVQSVAVRFIVEREKERRGFEKEGYFTILAQLEAGERKNFWVELRKVGEKGIEKVEKIKLFAGDYQVKKTIIDSAKKAQKIKKEVEGYQFKVKSVATRDLKRNPYPPFTTSQLQASAAALGFSPSQTMRIAQRLYEEGYITYHRTDSRFLSESAMKSSRRFIKENFGEQYLPKSAITYQTKSKVAQEAHEAIRPTDFSRLPSEVRKLGKDEEKLYELVWRHTLACEMRPAVFLRTTIEVEAGKYLFQGTGQILKFDGWLKVRPRVRERYKELEFPPLKEGQVLKLLKIESRKHETSSPPRYSEAALIRELKKHEIGRPSTYAPIISTIKKRGYVEKEGSYFVPTAVGEVVTGLLAEHFSNIVDFSFTARMEEDLDEIARGEREWVGVVREFWEPFSETLSRKSSEIKREEVTVLEKTDEACPECGKPVVVKLGKYGKFLSCTGFPQCKYARPLSDVDRDGVPDDVDQSQLEGGCPECRGELVVKEGKFGKFIACSNYPECKFTKPYLEKIGMKCPDCGKGEVIVKRSRKGKTFYGCSRYPECKFASWKDPRGKSKLPVN